jgi:endo-1,4-beta-xylanase
MTGVPAPALSGAAGEEKLPSLAEIYKDYFLVGTCYSAKDLKGERFELLKYQFSAVTAENAMKPDALRGGDGSFRFSGADNLYEIIEPEGIALVGHTLVWHQQSPKWLNTDEAGNPLSRAEALDNLTEHINGVAGHYAGKVVSWDVVNEAVADSPYPENWRDSLRKDSNWLKAFGTDAAEGEDGSDYVGVAFRLAREADPNAVLYYNDYNLDNQNKAKTVAAMVKEINDEYLSEGNDRLLIEGVGMQGHYSLGTSPDNVEASIELFKSLGVEISVTELDITAGSESAGALNARNEYKQAEVYAQLFEVFKRHSDVMARVTFWGIDDASSWRSKRFPLLFNADLTPKQAFYAVADPEGYLENFEMPERIEISDSKAIYGTPVLGDGTDPLWDAAEEIPVENMLQAWQTASGTAKTLWDEEYLYVKIQVKKSGELDNSSPEPHQRDSVEVFFDEENCKKGAYKIDDGQFRVGSDGAESFGDTTNGTGFESFVTVEPGVGYTAEMKLPWRVAEAKVGARIGFDAQINDAANGFRRGIAKWNDPTDESYIDTTNWGVLILSDAPKTPDVTEESEPAPKNGGKSSSGWIIAAIGAGLVLICAGALILIKRSRRKG